ncbi:hypothetical protein [Gemmatimonas sp.]|uniref:hypothetical protein n=1 Tax=Gemmatimonas sp. TaxID=1962908 RepID=UPI0022CB6A3F|nr:hypothetical protein [Gemmatimonas sp.]MCA2982702.1 hypothetical protein [Gemmatimonas sp.]MCA2995920.1 hypothetical protein [Gemmatimonas sp.]MCZ8012384.1 hypothetical protein [Gemmatimonas sp.]MCZ8266686.1 hypothetical protein [Gemmatimonas sp.]
MTAAGVVLEARALPTAAARRQAGRTPRTLHDHATWWLLVIVLVTVAGFTPSLTTRRGALDWAHAVHGGASVAWLLLLVAQSELARRGLTRGHRQLALVGVGCALVMCMSAVPMLQALAAAVTAADAVPARAAVPRFLLRLDFGLLACLLGLLAVALSQVRNRARHARAMAATALLALPAGLGRWAMRLLDLDPIGGSLVALGLGALWLMALAYSDARAGVRDRVYGSLAAALGAIAVLAFTGARAVTPS